MNLDLLKSRHEAMIRAEHEAKVARRRFLQTASECRGLLTGKGMAEFLGITERNSWYYMQSGETQEGKTDNE